MMDREKTFCHDYLFHFANQIGQLFRALSLINSFHFLHWKPVKRYPFVPEKNCLISILFLYVITTTQLYICTETETVRKNPLKLVVAWSTLLPPQ